MLLTVLLIEGVAAEFNKRNKSVGAIVGELKSDQRSSCSADRGCAQLRP